MYVPFEKKCEYWNHFVAKYLIEGNFIYGVRNKKLTAGRLGKIMSVVLSNDLLWRDMLCHDILVHTPEQLRERDREIYDHCRGNFWGWVADIAARLQVI